MLENKRNNLTENDEPSSPAWMTTYGDLMTLLLVFFVLLFSFSTIDLNKFKGFVSSLQAQLGVLEGGKTIMDEELLSRGEQGEMFNPSNREFDRMMGEMNQYINEQGLQEQVSLEQTERGLVVRILGQVLYEMGDAQIKPDGKKLLTKIADGLKKISNQIMVEGHTDNWPIHNDEFPSNWELSTSRATNVIKYFIENQDLDPTKLSAAGYSEYRPLCANDSPEHRAKNRRVEIVILNSLDQEDLDKESKI